MIRRPPRSTQSRSSAASDVYKRQQQRRAGLMSVLDEIGGEVISWTLPDESSEAARTLAQELRPKSVDVVVTPVSYTHLRAHETRHDLVCRLLLEKKKKQKKTNKKNKKSIRKIKLQQHNEKTQRKQKKTLPLS